MLTPTLKSNGDVALVGKQGTTWDLSLKLYSDTENTIPLDLNGYSARGHYRKNYDSPLAMAFECDIDLTGDANTITIHLDAATSAACTTYSGVYDIEIYTPNDEDVKRVMEGTLVIDREVTK